MRLQTDGLVIKSRNIGEADRLVTILTREHGIVNAFVRGARKMKGRMVSSTQQFAYSNFVLFCGKDAFVVDEAETIRIFFRFGNNDGIEKISLAYYFAELALALSPQGDNAEGFLRLLLNSLSFLADGKRQPAFLKAVLELRFLSMAGYMPNLLACEECGAFITDVMYFLPENGSIYCADCPKPNGGVEVGKGVVSAMRHIIYSEFEKLFAFSLPPESEAKLTYITEKYLFTQTQRRFQTLDFYKTVIGTDANPRF